jgi:glycosyltransferase involved in cell wall biosynthesis
MPRVSIVIPTYRHRDFILQTLDSVFAQTMRDFEIIVVNDGSPDDTAVLLAPHVVAGRLFYYEQTNQGQSRARNFGIERARGEYIALLDDDDLWPPDKLEWQTQFLDENPGVGLVAGTLVAIDERGTVGGGGVFWPSITFEALFAENPLLSPGQTLVRADLLKRLGGMNPTIWGADDWDLWLRIAKQSRLVMQDRLALYYRLHPANASKQTARLLEASIATFKTHIADVPHERHRALRVGFERTMYRGFGSTLVQNARHHLRLGDFRKAWNELRALATLWRGLAFDGETRSMFLRNVLGRE